MLILSVVIFYNSVDSFREIVPLRPQPSTFRSSVSVFSILTLLDCLATIIDVVDDPVFIQLTGPSVPLRVILLSVVTRGIITVNVPP